MSRDELRATFGASRAFRRGDYSVDLSDQYLDAGLLMLTCSAAEGLYLIEIPDPDGVHYRGVHLAGAVGTVVAELRAAGVEPIADDSGWHFADGAVALYTPSTRPDATVDAVTVFGPGHETGGEIIRIAAGEAAVAWPSRYEVMPGRGLDAVRFGESRDAVRRRLRGGLCWHHRADSREPVQDVFFEDGLVVRYGRDELVERIFVVQSGRATLGDVDLKPAYPRTVDDVRSALTAAGYATEDGEAGTTITGTGVEVWISRADAGTALPVSGVSLSPQRAGRSR